MARRLQGFLRQLRRVVRPADAANPTDGQLLESFLSGNDEAAFEALVCRHGPMVLGVCCRILENVHDAEDAFQATWLVLVRRAAAVVPRERVAGFLYGVACNTARKARALAARRRAREQQGTSVPDRPAPEDPWTQWRPVLDQELHGLPEKYRLPLVLCDLEGRTRKEAARQLGWAEGTVASRLARARALLARRLSRHGLALSGGALAVALSGGAATAAVAPLLVSTTVRTAILSATRQAIPAGFLSPAVSALTEGVLKAMLVNRLKVAAALLLAAALVVFGGGVLVQHTQAQKAPDPRPDGSGRNVLPKDEVDTLAVVRKLDLRDRTLAVSMSTNEGRLRDFTFPLARDVTVLLDDTLDGGVPAAGKLLDVTEGRGVVLSLVDPAKDPTVRTIRIVRVQLTQSKDGERRKKLAVFEAQLKFAEANVARSEAILKQAVTAAKAAGSQARDLDDKGDKRRKQARAALEAAEAAAAKAEADLEVARTQLEAAQANYNRFKEKGPDKDPDPDPKAKPPERPR